MKKNRTAYARAGEIKRAWHLIDAAGRTLGKLATKAAVYLRGKHKPIFSPHVDCGDFIVVINADRVRVSGKKAEDKTYFSHSGYPGGDKLLTFTELLSRNPAKVIRHAVAGMLPKNRLGRQIIKKLKIYAGAEHPHACEKINNLEV